jgi:hypothetical protein
MLAVAFEVTSRAATLGRVGHHDVGTSFGVWNEFYTLVSRIEGRGCLGGQDREDLDTLHVLLDIGAVDGPNDRSTWHEGRVEDALGQLGPCGAPRGLFAVQASDFDLNATRHRVLI